jgi:hypothetical protein
VNVVVTASCFLVSAFSKEAPCECSEQKDIQVEICLQGVYTAIGNINSCYKVLKIASTSHSSNSPVQ